MLSQISANGLFRGVISVARHVGGFLVTMGCMTLIAVSPFLLFAILFVAPAFLDAPKNKLLAEVSAPGLPYLAYRLWRMPGTWPTDGVDRFAVELVSLRTYTSRIVDIDTLPVEIVWQDASHLEIALPNLAIMGDHPREAFGVTVHVRFVPDDPEARRKHFEERGR